jgi:hypothetical protein
MKSPALSATNANHYNKFILACWLLEGGLSVKSRMQQKIKAIYLQRSFSVIQRPTDGLRASAGSDLIPSSTYGLSVPAELSMH